MEARSKAPFLAQDSHEVAEVVGVLNQHVGKKSRTGFVVKKKTYKIFDGSGRTVDSWGLNDWDYKKPDLPTYARGLFTHKNNGRPEIAARGYDKFFNVGEVRQTEWPNLESNTRGPYELSVKENGCIIFIGGLDDNTLLVTSKHSTGHRIDASANHALTGEQWVERQLKVIGKSKADLAKRLRELNVTAVAELCDDQFEEHVLEYTPEQAGLYLHGMNLNLPEFATYPGNLVHEFADEWGFRRVQFVMKDKIEQVKPFLEEVALTGNYNGRDTEGFVVRCQLKNKSGEYNDWFFKYKFEEPYLMYRQWREVTKQVISGKAPRIRKHKKVTEEYLVYARQQLAKDPKLGQRFNNNHGIIAMRNGFLAHKGRKGHELIDEHESTNDEAGESVTHNVLLAPIATIGCGKTTVALALTKLFGWGHEQNDNIQGKGRPARFVQALTSLMAAHPVVIADRNNHQRMERAQLIDDVKRIVPDTTFIALNWVHDNGTLDEIKQFTADRVLGRGDNHQTIHPDTKGSKEILGIMQGFYDRFQPLDTERRPDSGFDLVIDLDVLADSRANLGTIVKQFHESYPKLYEVPSEEAMDQAVDWALDYKPTIKHDLSRGGNQNKGPSPAKSKNETALQNRAREDKNQKPAQNGPAAAPKKPRGIEYFSVSFNGDVIRAALEDAFAAHPEASAFYHQLKSTGRIQNAFHVTLMHKASQSQYPQYWQELNKLWNTASSGADPATLIGGVDGGFELGRAGVQLDRIVYDGRIMAIAANILDDNFKTTNAIAHITVGTAADAIKPKESNDMLAAWAKGGDGRIVEVELARAYVLDGSVRAFLSR